MRPLRFLTVLVILLAGAVALDAQGAVTEADITKLETTATDISKQLPALEKSDATFAADVKKTLTALQDDITYLKVKMRREGSVTRAEYGDVRDRLETLRIKSQAVKAIAQPVVNEGMPRLVTVPAGTEIEARLQTPLNSGTAKVEQRFEAITRIDLVLDGAQVIPAGSLVRGFVSSVRAAGHVDRKGSLTLSFDELRIEGRSYKLRASVSQVLDGKVSDDATRIGIGAAVGGIIGGLLGGGKGALAGVLIGGGGTIASTEGADVDLPVGTILHLRIDQPVEIAVK